MTDTLTDHKGREIVIHYDHTPASRGSRWDSPVDESWDVYKVEYKGRDITRLYFASGSRVLLSKRTEAP